ncbi:tyrosine-protein phosphatase [Eubacterium multiforme]|uniref:Protein-tyrosine phosphatase n=1 Tax=Eubacterium multiforme TaxID=83339 RepID=A0ABT9UXN9_9FIRM|nr:tyrosine-protein phosphatase [Eubacterium multiforme]MDQ0151087.1 protein-tyrosine phosphatase [Eubacterium multiforme]
MNSIEFIEIKEIEEGHISIEYKGEYLGTVKIYYGKTPSVDLDDKKLIATMNSNEIVIKNPNKKIRGYYVLVLEDDKKYLAAKRLVNLNGTTNFRDIGGYLTESGKRVKWGKIYRSDQLSDLDCEDIKFVEKLGIKTIVDFRSKAEANAAINKEIKGTKTYSLDPNAKVAQLAAGSVDDNNNKNKTTMELLKTNEFNAKAYGNPKENMLKEYRKFINSKEAKKAYRSLMDIICDENNLPLVQHCRGGKDRTGFGVAIILLALGVSEEEIIKDYELTTIYRGLRNERQMDKYRQYTDDAEILELLSTMQQSKGEYMREAINEIKKAYGTVDNYLERVLGLDKIKKEKLREKLLY